LEIAVQLLTRAALFALLRHSAHAVAVVLTLLVPRVAFGGPPATSIRPLALERRSLAIAAVDGGRNGDSLGADQEFALANLGIGSSAARSYINGPAPSITAISPNPAPGAVGWVTTTLTVTGANFVNKPKVVAAFAPFVGDTSIVDPSRITFVSSTQLLVSVDIWREATEVSTGSWTIRVTNPDGQSSNAAPLTISTPVPVISGGSTNPGAPVAGQQFTATFNGSNYVIGSARLVVTGPGCAPCVIPNSALTTQTPTNLIGPITLASAGNYTIAVQNGTNGPQSSARVLVTALSPVIAPHVTPKGARLNGLTLSATVVRNFQISNLGSTSAIYQLIPVCVSSSSCSLGRSSIALGAGATDSVPLTFIGPSQPSTSETVRVAATVTTEDGTVASDTGSVVATSGTIDAWFGVTATPLTPSAVLPPNWISAPYQWTLTNRGTQRNTYWTGYNTGAMTITWQPDTIIVLEPGQSRTLMIGVKAPNDPTYFTQVALNVDIVDADSLPLPNIPTQIVAISPMTFMASSSIYKVSVVPKNQDYRLVMPYGGGFEGEFWITNTGPNTGSFNYALACTGIVLNCRPSASGNNAPLTGSVTLAYQQQLHLQFSADLPQGSQQQGGASGIAKLSVVGVGAASSASDTGSYSLQFAGGSGGASVIAVSPKTTRTVPANLAQTQQFTVSNSGNVTGNVTYAVSCSGTAIVSCNAPDHASANITAQSSDVVTVGFTTAAANRTGTVKLIASSGTVADTGFVSITSGATNGPLTIAMNSLNPGTSISRGQCLTIAAGDDAAYECGDLRLVHALPTTTTLNKARTPTLIYTSAHAHPVTLIAVDVTVDGTSSQLNGACATQITARLRFANADTAERAFPWTGPCGQRATRRVVVPVDAQAHSMATGVYPYVLQVTVAANGLSWTASDSSGVLAVVNRSGGHFGAGWWLDGVEQLFAVPGHNDQLFWVGGDGSTRLYTQVASSNLFMVNPTLDRPDSIVKMSDTDYRRRLRNGAYVQFGAFLLHSRTVNASGQATQFVWNTSTGQLDSIMLAVPNPSNSGSRRVYAFTYTSGLLTSVTSPSRPNGGARTTTLARIGNDLAITDPGSVPVQYVSDVLGRDTTTIRRRA
jgi:hypothetical protein